MHCLKSNTAPFIDTWTRELEDNARAYCLRRTTISSKRFRGPPPLANSSSLQESKCILLHQRLHTLFGVSATPSYKVSCKAVWDEIIRLRQPALGHNQATGTLLCHSIHNRRATQSVLTYSTACSVPCTRCIKITTLYSIIVRGSKMLLVMREGDQLHSLTWTPKKERAGTYSYNKKCSAQTWFFTHCRFTDKGRAQPLTLVTWRSRGGLQ